MKPTKLALLGCFLAAPAFAVSSNGYVQQQGQDPQAPVHTPRQKGDFSDFDTVEVLCSADTSGDYIATALCTLTNDIARDKGRDVGLKRQLYLVRSHFVSRDRAACHFCPH
jgi:hypothetical protein